MSATRDFSLPMLERLLMALKHRGHRFVRFKDYYENRSTFDAQDRIILFRHDVDRYPATALATGRLEDRLGCHGTYYFRARSWTFKPRVLKALADMGHEIGYHYECLPDCRGDFDAAARLFKANLDKMRACVSITTASMHSRPLSRWDGRRLWDRFSLEQFGLLGEAYRSIDHYRYTYLADSGRNWNADRNVVWDSVQGSAPPEMTNGTNGLIHAIENGRINSVQLLIHPNRWPRGLAGWISQTLQDSAINVTKTAIRQLRKRSSAVSSPSKDRHTTR